MRRFRRHAHAGDAPPRSRRVDDGKAVREYLTVHECLSVNTAQGGREKGSGQNERGVHLLHSAKRMDFEMGSWMRMVGKRAPVVQAIHIFLRVPCFPSRKVSSRVWDGNTPDPRHPTKAPMIADHPRRSQLTKAPVRRYAARGKRARPFSASRRRCDRRVFPAPPTTRPWLCCSHRFRHHG